MTNTKLEYQLMKFANSINLITNTEKEQISGADCGSFALQNMWVMAKAISYNKEAFIKGFEEFEGFCSSSLAKNLRKGEFAELYVVGKYQEMINETIKAGKLQKLREQHNSEVAEIASVLQREEEGSFDGITIRAVAAKEDFGETTKYYCY